MFPIDGAPLVGKFYHPHLLAGPKRGIHERRLQAMIREGPPSPNFVWPIELVSEPVFGYMMARVPAEFVSLRKLNWSDPAAVDYKTRLRIAYRLVDCFASLHLRRGMAYCDLSCDNVLCNPKTSEVRIIDNDNLTVGGEPSPLAVLGTHRYIAPELLGGLISQPNMDTDLHSLAVLIYETLLFHHPLLGDRVLAGPPEAEEAALARKALYVQHPVDRSNSMLDHAKWGGVPVALLPKAIQQCFEAAFVDGLHHPNLRVRETRWRRVLVNHLDLLARCGNPGCLFGYSFFDPAEPGRACVWCGHHIGDQTVIKISDPNGKLLRYKTLMSDDWLTEHHCKLDGEFRFRPESACGKIESDATVGLTVRNASKEDFYYYHPGEDAPRQFPPGARVPLKVGYRIQFGANGTVAEVMRY